MSREPERFEVLGVGIDALDPARALAAIESWISEGRRSYLCFANVHAVMEARSDPRLRAVYAGAGLVVPDGMPLVWLGRLLGRRDVRRVYGPDALLAACRLAAEKGWRCYFYGGAPGVAAELAAELERRFPGLPVAGTAAPPFGDRSLEDDERDIRHMNAAKPDIVWVALGCPRQERWMAEHRAALDAPVLAGVGAAFDFHTGRVRQAPAWMGAAGLEWLYRLAQEPRRLWRRYLILNPLFVTLVILERLGLARRERGC